jgi:hypothetical protein
MNDILGREIKIDDFIIYATYRKTIAIGKVLEFVETEIRPGYNIKEIILKGIGPRKSKINFESWRIVLVDKKNIPKEYLEKMEEKI